jgi:hypothetical protein
MLFRILRLFGLDVPAKIEAAKASLELRVERASERAKEVAQASAVIVVLAAFAMAAFGMAFVVGLIALYRWTAEAYGEYAGLSVVGGVLVAGAVVLASVAAIKAGSLTKDRAGPGTAGDDDQGNAIVPAPAIAPSVPPAPVASASDLVEPLAYFMSKTVNFPAFRNPAVNEMIGRLGGAARGSADEVVDRAADVVRYGDRLNLALVLTGTAIAAWLVTRNSRR